MLLELHDDKHKRTLYVELSHDGTYWNVNSGGIFRNKYTDKNDIFGPNPQLGAMQSPTLLKLLTVRPRSQRVKLLTEAGTLPKQYLPIAKL